MKQQSQIRYIVIDVFARKFVGWRVSASMTMSFVPDALNQAICQHCSAKGSGLIHYSGRGNQYLSLRYNEWLANAGIVTSVGSVGDSHDNALPGKPMVPFSKCSGMPAPKTITNAF